MEAKLYHAWIAILLSLLVGYTGRITFEVYTSLSAAIHFLTVLSWYAIGCTIAAYIIHGSHEITVNKWYKVGDRDRVNIQEGTGEYTESDIETQEGAAMLSFPVLLLSIHFQLLFPKFTIPLTPFDNFNRVLFFVALLFILQLYCVLLKKFSFLEYVRFLAYILPAFQIMQIVFSWLFS
ncbi:hypothetical protein [Spirochaeta africana]|uniref:Uncharacterized protein n=1 Tax=Spirochaeta africana (strain ATCC 700263 / DSM 8902 / Z-7692) TaxID=889378 RepID=H9ULZ5_SPIAZ|nr:hypothetical protein [Spirochaeta africana]AFG38538.1 hypothetical protein Spiaf_2508 [Spirochaeta africana DSM 8902]